MHPWPTTRNPRHSAGNPNTCSKCRLQFTREQTPSRIRNGCAGAGWHLASVSGHDLSAHEPDPGSGTVPQGPLDMTIGGAKGKCVETKVRAFHPCEISASNVRQLLERC